MIHCLHSWKLFISYRNVFIFILDIADVTFNLLLQKHLKALPGAFTHLFPKYLRVIALKPHFYQENSTPMSIYLHRIPNSDTEPQLWQMWQTTYLNTGIVRIFLNCSLKEGGKNQSFYELVCGWSAVSVCQITDNMFLGMQTWVWAYADIFLMNIFV